MWGRANINHWHFFFPRGRCHRLTVWVMNLRLRDQINPGCRSPCRTPTGWCRSEAGHANPGWSRSILVCPGWLAIMHLYFLHVTYNYCSRTQFLLSTHFRSMDDYGCTYPTFLDSESSDVQFIFVNSLRGFSLYFPSVVCGFLESNLQTLTNLDWYENCCNALWVFGIMPSFPESQGPQTVLVKVKDTQKAWLTKLPHVFLLFLKWPSSFADFVYCANEVMEEYDYGWDVCWTCFVYIDQILTSLPGSRR